MTATLFAPPTEVIHLSGITWQTVTTPSSTPTSTQLTTRCHRLICCITHTKLNNAYHGSAHKYGSGVGDRS
jgi:hypothetical protein